MKKIGVILNSKFIDDYFYSILKDLSNRSDIEITLININKPYSHVPRATFFNRINCALINVILKIEVFLLCPVYPQMRRLLKKYVLLDVVKLSKNFKIENSDLDKNSFDLILSDDSLHGMVKSYSNLSKDGVLFFESLNKISCQSRIAFFWPVYLKKDTTDFKIYYTHHSKIEKNILFKGRVPTQKLFSENVQNILTTEANCLKDIVINYLNNIENFSEIQPSATSESIKIPSFFDLIKYLQYVTTLLCISVSNKLMSKNISWHVSYINKSWEYADLKKATSIANPKGRYFADPFIISRNGRTICFVEDYSIANKRGCISAIEIIDNEKYQIIGPVIIEPFHMSFPFLLEYENELYMIPETSEAKSIRLYKCTSFPLVWEYQYNLLEGEPFLDSIVFEKNHQWHLITSKPDYSLHLFHGINPISKNWLEHKKNPILLDSTISRNGGLLIDERMNIVRCRQKQGFNIYGESLTLAMIEDITSSTFKESEIKKIIPNFLPNIIACHHMHSNNKYTVVDFLK